MRVCRHVSLVLRDIMFCSLRFALQALLLLLIKSVQRGIGNQRYDVPTPLHLAQCSKIPQELWDAYYRQAAQW